MDVEFLPGTASLVEEVDKRLLVVLRDGRKLIGTLRSFDQFANVVLENCFERIYVDERYGEKAMGLYVIRGENVVLLGELDEEKDANKLPKKLKKVDFMEAKKAYEKERIEKEEQMKQKRKVMLDLGIAIDPFTLIDTLNFD